MLDLRSRILSNRKTRNKSPVFATVEEWRRTRDSKLLEKLVLDNLPLVEHLSFRILGRRTTVSDWDEWLYVTGTFAIVSALEGWDPVKGPFASYCAFKVRLEIQRWQQSQGVVFYRASESTVMPKVVRERLARGEGPGTLHSGRWRITERMLEKWRNCRPPQYCSFADPCKGRANPSVGDPPSSALTLEETIHDPDVQTPEDEAETTDMSEKLESEMRKLTPLERCAIAVFVQKTQKAEAVRKHFRCTQEALSKAAENGLAKLREVLVEDV